MRRHEFEVFFHQKKTPHLKYIVYSRIGSKRKTRCTDEPPRSSFFVLFSYSKKTKQTGTNLVKQGSKSSRLMLMLLIR